MTVRCSSRLRPLVRELARSIGEALAQTVWLCWCRVGWLSLTWTISATLAAAAASNSFFDSATHRA